MSVRSLEGIDPRFSPELEAEYRQAKFSEYGNLSMRLGIAGIILAAFLWLMDYVIDPVGARNTIVPRLLIALTILIYVISVSIGLRRAFTLGTCACWRSTWTTSNRSTTAMGIRGGRRTAFFCRDVVGTAQGGRHKRQDWRRRIRRGSA